MRRSWPSWFIRNKPKPSNYAGPATGGPGAGAPPSLQQGGGGGAAPPLAVSNHTFLTAVGAASLAGSLLTAGERAAGVSLVGLAAGGAPAATAGAVSGLAADGSFTFTPVAGWWGERGVVRVFDD